jgi:hypothetical protein
MSRRVDRVAAFRRRVGKGGYVTALRPAGDLRPCDGVAVRNWFLQAPRLHPVCFGCGRGFSSRAWPSAFLTVVPADRSPKAGVAVSGLCPTCFALPADQVETLALACLRRDLDSHGKWLGGAS